VLEALAEATVNVMVGVSPGAEAVEEAPAGTAATLGTTRPAAPMAAALPVVQAIVLPSEAATLAANAASAKACSASATAPALVMAEAPEGVALSSPTSAVFADAAAAPGKALERNGAVVPEAAFAVEPSTAPPTRAIAAPVAVTLGAPTTKPASDTMNPVAAHVTLALAGFGCIKGVKLLAADVPVAPITGTGMMAVAVTAPAAEVEVAPEGVAASETLRLVEALDAAAAPASGATSGTTAPAELVATVPDAAAATVLVGVAAVLVAVAPDGNAKIEGPSDAADAVAIA
jgi:hypothetical protein